MQETCDRLMGQAQAATGASSSVYRILMELPGDFPSMEQVACTLNMTSQTLRRRLEAEGTTFQIIADEVRSTLAHEYLRTTKFSVLDIAILLGFSNSAGFRKALKRWTGMIPSQIRR
ncbi:helix-turn-helix transcriptional regulator [Halomonas colorata]|uniref:helix-turn-helix transcriptional regulator n=2 Tax=Halomonas TaxID=2745 RepID=UPI0029CA2DB0|nr:AraC family transcriptional regulator [Halomonas colorata]